MEKISKLIKITLFQTKLIFYLISYFNNQTDFFVLFGKKTLRVSLVEFPKTRKILNPRDCDLKCEIPRIPKMPKIPKTREFIFVAKIRDSRGSSVTLAIKCALYIFSGSIIAQFLKLLSRTSLSGELLCLTVSKMTVTFTLRPHDQATFNFLCKPARFTHRLTFSPIFRFLIFTRSMEKSLSRFPHIFLSIINCG